MAHLLATVVLSVNAFVQTKGSSNTLPPFTIVEGMLLDFNLCFRVARVEFVQTYEGTDNTMLPLTVGAVELGQCDNLQGGLRCCILVSGIIL